MFENFLTPDFEQYNCTVQAQPTLEQTCFMYHIDSRMKLTVVLLILGRHHKEGDCCCVEHLG